MNSLRLVCTLAIFFGGYNLLRSPNAGPLTNAYRVFLVVGGAVGLICLEARAFLKQKKESEDAILVQKGQAEQQPTQQPPPTTIETPQANPERPAWMGDPAGNRRRLVIILVGLALFGCAAVLFFIFAR